MLEFPENTFGMALNLEQDSVGAVILGDYKHISEGHTVKTTGKILEVPIGEALLGRVVDALGNPIDGKGAINTDESAPIEKVAPGVLNLLNKFKTETPPSVLPPETMSDSIQAIRDSAEKLKSKKPDSLNRYIRKIRDSAKSFNLNFRS